MFQSQFVEIANVRSLLAIKSMNYEKNKYAFDALIGTNHEELPCFRSKCNDNFDARMELD